MMSSKGAIMTSPGIYFGEYQFSEPELIAAGLLGLSSLMGTPGLYAIMIADPYVNPRPFRILYIGESGNVQLRATREHENYEAWQRAGGQQPLYRAFHFMANSTELQRRMVESELIAKYRPPCNERLSTNWAE
jgi:hypothetical protein